MDGDTQLGMTQEEHDGIVSETTSALMPFATRIGSVSLEGGEGAGKGTVAGILVDSMKACGIDVMLVREPGSTSAGEAIRSLIMDGSLGVSDATEALLFAAAREQLVDTVIAPAVKDGKTILLDRYVHSSFVYQGIVSGLGLGYVSDINAEAMRRFMPDLPIYLDVPASHGLHRISADGDREVNRIDRMPIGFHDMVHDGYRQLVDMGMLVGIDADRPVQDVMRAITDAMSSRFNR